MVLLLAACAGPTEPSGTLPSISCPGPVAVHATTATGAPVTFSAPTVTGGLEPVTTYCTPVSGASFPNGITEVTCVASDALQRLASCRFNVTVARPPRLTATRFLAFGDSITWGAKSAWMSVGGAQFYIAAANGGYPERLQASLSARHPTLPITMFNDGLPGELAVNALSRFRTMLTTRRPHVVLLLEGINDLSNDISVSRTVGGLRSMLDSAAVVGVPVLLATMYQTYEETSPEGSLRTNGAAYVPAFNVAVRQLAAGRPNVHLVDLEPAMANRALVGADGVHLEEAGFDVMAARFQAVLEAAFPVRGSFQ
jgi:lysophospholipase L1-like esterase